MNNVKLDLIANLSTSDEIIGEDKNYLSDLIKSYREKIKLHTNRENYNVLVEITLKMKDN